MTELPTPPKYVEPYKYDDSMSDWMERGQMKPVFGPDITDSGVIAQVRRAYRDTAPNQTVSTDGTRHLKFHTAWLNPSEKDTVTAVGFIGDYNRFDWEDTQELVKNLDGEKNRISIGREGSPALYFWTVEPHHVVDSLLDLNVPDSRIDGRYAPSAPDELSVYVGADYFPSSGKFGAPDSMDFGTVVYDIHTDGDDLDELIVHEAEIESGEHYHGAALIRAWWD